jgi:hypothetical protein
MDIEQLITNIENDYGYDMDPISNIYVMIPLIVKNPNENHVDNLALINAYLPIKRLLTRSNPFPFKFLPSGHGNYVKLEPSGLLLPKNVADMNNFEYTTESPEIITLTYR